MRIQGVHLQRSREEPPYLWIAVDRNLKSGRFDEVRLEPGEAYRLAEALLHYANILQGEPAA